MSGGGGEEASLVQRMESCCGGCSSGVILNLFCRSSFAPVLLGSLAKVIFYFDRTISLQVFMELMSVLI